MWFVIMVYYADCLLLAKKAFHCSEILSVSLFLSSLYTYVAQNILGFDTSVN